MFVKQYRTLDVLVFWIHLRSINSITSLNSSPSKLVWKLLHNHRS
jgi:hypothetical protein